MTCGVDTFVSVLGLCISHGNAISGALVAASASLVTTGWKIWSDRGIKRERNDFERSERHARETFERIERQSRQSFEADLAKSNAESLARAQKELHDLVQLGKWREESWQRNLACIKSAIDQLGRATTGIASLVDDGPTYDDLKMIRETARVLDVFGDFQTSVGHFELPNEIQTLAGQVIERVTETLLSLSPRQEIRQSSERRAMLGPLKVELLELNKRFRATCARYIENPPEFQTACLNPPG